MTSTETKHPLVYDRILFDTVQAIFAIFSTLFFLKDQVKKLLGSSYEKWTDIVVYVFFQAWDLKLILRTQADNSVKRFCNEAIENHYLMSNYLGLKSRRYR